MTHRAIQMSGMGSMLKDGTQHLSGLEEAVLRNIEACKQLSQITRTSMGPNGMNKLVVNHLEKLFLTNDAATIMAELDVSHPAAKMLVMASQMQDHEIGDATNLVVVLAGELLDQADSLIRTGLHPSEIVSGYVKAGKKVQQVMDELTCYSVDDVRDADKIAHAIRSVIASKQYGYEDLLSPLIAKACVQIMPKNPKQFNVDNVRIAKIMGSGVHDSRVMKGLVIGRDAEGTIKHVTNAKIAVYAGGVDLPKTETKGTVLIKTAEDLQAFSKGEEKRYEEFLKGIADMGVKVIVSGNAVHELAQHFCERYKIMLIKVMSKFEVQRVCRATGSVGIMRAGPPVAEELGFCDLVSVEEIGGSRVTVFRQDAEDSAISTIVVRGSTQNTLDDIERAISDGVNIVKQICRDQRFVAGGGATEIELARVLLAEAQRTPGLDQYAIRKFAEALEVVPRTLAENAGHNSMVCITNLYAAHEKGEAHAGVDIEEGSSGVANMRERGVVDHLVTKQQAMRLAVDAATTVLRVDQIIMMKPAGGPAPRSQQGPMDHGDA